MQYHTMKKAYDEYISQKESTALFFENIDKMIEPGYSIDKIVTCKNGLCNNGCSLPQIVRENAYDFGAVVSRMKDYADHEEYRKVIAPGIMAICLDSELAGYGNIEVIGRRLGKNKCHLTVKVDKGNNYYSPNLEVFRKKTDLTHT